MKFNCNSTFSQDGLIIIVPNSIHQYEQAHTQPHAHTPTHTHTLAHTLNQASHLSWQKVATAHHIVAQSFNRIFMQNMNIQWNVPRIFNESPNRKTAVSGNGEEDGERERQTCMCAFQHFTCFMSRALLRFVSSAGDSQKKGTPQLAFYESAGGKQLRPCDSG